MPFRTTVTRGGKMVLLPISDSSKVQTVGPGNGSHWSLLLWDGKNGNNFYHIESLHEYHLHHAKTICGKINSFFNFFSKFTLLNVKTPKQANNVDSGVHMLINADAIIWNAIENLSFSLKSVQELLPLSKPNIQA